MPPPFGPEVVEVPFAGGLTDHISKRRFAPGSFFTFENVEILDEWEVVARRGYGYLPDPARAVQHVATRGDDLYGLADAAVNEAPGLVAYHEPTASWSRQCDAWRIGSARRSVGRDPRGALFAQRVVVGSRVVFVWWSPVDSEGGDLTFRVEDGDGTLIGQVSALGTSTTGLYVDGEFKVCVTAGLVCVVSKSKNFVPGAPDPFVLRLTVFDAAALEFPFLLGGPLFLDYDTGAFDAKAIPVAQGYIAVAHTSVAEALGSKRLKLSTVNISITSGGGSAVVQTATVATTGNAMVAVSLCAVGSTVAAAYRQNSAGTERVKVAKWVGFLANGTFTGAPIYDTTVWTGLSNAAFGTLKSFGVGLGQDVVTEPNGYIVCTTNDSAVLAKRIDDAGVVAPNELGVPDWRVSSALLLSEPFALGGRVFALLGALLNAAQDTSGQGGTLVGTVALVCVHPGINENELSAFGLGDFDDPGARYVAALAAHESLSGRLFDRLACHPTPSSHGLLVPSYDDDGNAFFAPTVLFGAPTSNRDFAVGADEIKFELERGPVYADASDLVVTSGGLTAQYDGRTWAEVGFIHRPERCAPFGVANVVGSSALASGDYVYAAHYERVDDAGNLERSEPAFAAVNVSPPGGSSAVVTLTVRCLGLTQKPGVTIAVYRTLVNTPGPFYRLSPRSLEGDALLNDPKAESVSFEDDYTDAEAQGLGFGLLYTDAGLRAVVAPPPSLFVCEHGNRLWLVSADDPRELWFSRTLVKGEPPCFSRDQVLRVDGLGGPLVALASHGDRLLLFTELRIAYLYGSGPDDTLQNGQFSEAIAVRSSCGCSDPNSVITTDLGTFFKSPKGLMLIDPGMKVAPVGKPAGDAFRAFPYVRRVALDDGGGGAEAGHGGRVVWLVATSPSGAAGASKFVWYDYDHDAWGTWRINPHASMRDHVVWRGEHVVSDGRPALRGHGDVPAADDPDGSYVGVTIRVPPFSAGGPGGTQLLSDVTIVGERVRPCMLRVKTFTDYEETAFDQNKLFDYSSTSTAKRLPLVFAGFEVKVQECTAKALEITTEVADGDDESAAQRGGLKLTGVHYHVQPLSGPARLPVENRR